MNIFNILHGSVNRVGKQLMLNGVNLFVERRVPRMKLTRD